MTQPKEKIRIGAISATIWENEQKGKDGKEYKSLSCTIDKNYKDKDDKWKTTNSYNANELAKLRLAIDKAFEYMSTTKKEEE